jgi:hypothetical protein
MKLDIRKKLTFAIVGLIVNWLVAYLRQRGIDVTPEESAAILDQAQNISFGIVGLFMVAQGIADHGKEAAKVAKNLLIFVLVGNLVGIGVPAYAQPEGPESEPTASCCADLDACEELLDECVGADCPPKIECPVIPECPDCEKICEGKCGWVVLVKDKTFMSAVLGGAVFLIGGIAGIFLAPN